MEKEPNPKPPLSPVVWALLAMTLVLGALWPAIARCDQPGGPAFQEETSKQEAIYHSRGENVPQGYVIDRSLLSYASLLPPGFDRALANLGPRDRWLDIGAGQGIAILDYYMPRYDSMHPQGREQRGRKAQAVAISIEDRRTPRWHETAARLEANQIQYRAGKRLRQYSGEELGQFQLITDLIGGFSYTAYLSLFMEKVLSLLELNGTFYTLLLDVRLENEPTRAVDADVQLLTEIQNGDGSNIGVCSWLKSIACVEVTCEPDTRSTRPVELYSVRKVCSQVAVPALESLSFQAGTPPQRRFSARTLPGSR